MRHLLILSLLIGLLEITGCGASPGTAGSTEGTSDVPAFFAWDGVQNYSKLPSDYHGATLYLNPVEDGRNRFTQNAAAVQSAGGSLWYLMSGDPDNDYIDAQIKLIQQADRNSSTPIYGMAVDIEPWPQFTDQNSSDNQAAWQAWLDRLGTFRDKLHAHRYKLSVMIPFWLDTIPAAWPNNRPINYDVMDIADEVVVMDYTTDPQRFVSFAQHTLAYADQHNTSVKLAIEIIETVEDNISFYYHPEQVQTILDLNISHPSFAGFVIHTLDAYVKAQP